MIKTSRALIHVFCLLVPFFCGANSKPDMLIYLADDLSQQDLSIYGNQHIPTPHLAEIATQGMVFEHAYVASPSCAPSRAALLTGLMPAKNGAEENHTYPHKHIPSLIKQLQQLGYEVAAFGKIAHGKQKHAEQFGFDHYQSFKKAYNYDNIDKLDKAVSHYLQNRTSKKPLALFVGTTNPHVPWNDPKVTFSPSDVELPPKFIDTPETRKHRAKYYQQIKNLDDFAGRLIELQNQFMNKNTIFLFSSDHGSQWPFGKWTLYDYGTRVPLVVSWPNNIPTKRTTNMVSWIDILPTLIDIAGGKTPNSIDGQSFKSTLLSNAPSHRQEIFTTHTGGGNKNLYPSRAVRTAQWKLIHNISPELAFTNHSDLLRLQDAGLYWHEWWVAAKTDPRAQAVIMDYHQSPEFEFYDLNSDPWETKNLIHDESLGPQIAELKQKLKIWMQAQNDTVKHNQTPRYLAHPEKWLPNNLPIPKWFIKSASNRKQL